jgi:Uma2 family endonuclease
MSILSLPTPALPTFAVQPLRWTVDEFHNLYSQPRMESRKLILVEGVILEMPAPNPPHDAALLLTNEALRIAFGPGNCVRIQMSLVLSQATDPMPDLAVVPGSPRDYKDHPRTAKLVVKVSDSTLAYDKREKAGLYAAAGIQDYWIVDLIHRQLIVHRDPLPDATQPGVAIYRDIKTLAPGQSITPLAAPQSQVAVTDLLP